MFNAPEVFPGSKPEAAIEAAPAVANVLARELGRDEAWKARDLEDFYNVAHGYVYEGE